jgi:hypothetical protein
MREPDHMLAMLTMMTRQGTLAEKVIITLAKAAANAELGEQDNKVL